MSDDIAASAAAAGPGPGVTEVDAATAPKPVPSYKRKRSSKACVVCRQKKVRCSGNEPCRHCIEFGETCLFDDAAVAQPTRTFTELQLRIIRLETYIIQLTGKNLAPLTDFRGVDAEDGSSSWNTPVPAGVFAASISSTRNKRQRQRQDEATSDPENGVPSASSSKYPHEQSQSEAHAQHALNSNQQFPHGLESQEDFAQAYLEEAKFLQTMNSNHDRSLPRGRDADQRVLYHPSTSRIRATARDLPPEEMFSTDEDETAAQRELPTRAIPVGMDGADTIMDSRTLDDNAPHSPPLSSRRGFVFESSNPNASTTTSASMKRTGSASSAPAALGPTTAKISSSNASDFRVDKKGNLRYLGSASTSAVVAELADRQRWDAESPAMIHNAQNAAAARRRSSVRLSNGHNGSNGNAGNGDSGTASANSSLAAVEEMDDTPTDPAAPAVNPANREFARPPMRPKPWEIFSNLGVTVAGALPPVEEIALPPEDLARKLVDGFFEHIHPLFPVLHRTALVKDMNTVYLLRSKGEMRKADAPFLTLLFAVFACGALVSEDPRVFEEGGYSDDAKTYPVEQGPLDPFAQWQNDLLSGEARNNSNDANGSAQTKARTSTYNFGLSDASRRQGVRRAGHRYYAQVNILILHSLFQPSVDQAVLYGLMAYYHVSSNAAARAWLLSGQALRLAIELGLHRSSANFKPYVRERRRRVFWALFSLESLLANNLGRPPSIPLYEIDQETPENLCLDDLLPSLTTHGPPRKGEIAGFLHLVKLHWILAETLRTISRHQRHTRPISAAELQKRLLKYEMEVKDWFCNFPPEFAYKPDVPHGGLSGEQLTQNYIMHLSFHCALLLLFMPFMPRKGEEATEFQMYALARCVGACKDHIDYTAKYQYPVPPSHYLFNITQHLLVAGALLLLICHRGLQDPTLLDRTIKDVDSSINVLKLIGHRFVGGTIGAEMVQNMKDNMKHSETWKTRQRKIAEAEATTASASAGQSQGPLFPSIPLPGPRRISGIVQPSATNSRTSPTHRTALHALPEETNVNPALKTAKSTLKGAASQSDGMGNTGMMMLGNPAAVATSPAGHASQQYPGSMMMANYSTHEPGYLYPTQPSPVYYGIPDWQAPHLHGQGLAPPNNGTSFLDEYLQMSSSSYAGNSSYAHPSMMQTYNTPESQPLWPSDDLNFNIKGLEEITARSYNSSFMNNNTNGYQSNSSQYPFYQF